MLNFLALSVLSLRPALRRMWCFWFGSRRTDGSPTEPSDRPRANSLIACSPPFETVAAGVGAGAVTDFDLAAIASLADLSKLLSTQHILHHLRTYVFGANGPPPILK